MKYLKLISVIALATIIYACNDEESRIDKFLAEAESYVMNEPEKALSALDSIFYPDELDAERLYDYLLLQIQAKDRTYRDIKSDSIVFEIKDYYKKKNNKEKLALATYYCGRVLHEKGYPKEAMTEYLEAESAIENTSGNDNLKGLIQSSIGLIFYREMLEKEARTRFFNARRYYMAAGNKKNEIISTSQIGHTYMLSEMNDSAYTSYQKALGMADQLKDTSIQVMVRQNIGIIYRIQKNYGTAKQYFMDALNYSNTHTNKTKIYLNLARVYQGEHKTDSALYSLNTALDIMKDETGSQLFANIYKSFSDVYKSQNDYITALNYHEQYSAALRKYFSESESEALSNIQRKYNYELERNINNKLKIQRLTILLVSIGIVLVLLVLVYYFVRESRRQRMIRVQKEKEIVELNNMSKNFDEKEDTFRARVLYHFNIMRKSALLEGYLREDEKKIGQKLVKKFNEVVYNQETMDWDMLYDAMNEVHRGFFDVMRKTYPQLDETEFRICCLIYTDFSNAEIGIIMKCSSNTITARRSAIRKKIGIKYYGNIVEHLTNEISKKAIEINNKSNPTQKKS